MRRLSLAALVNCCRASVSLGARLVRLGLLDACLLQLKSADAADEDDQQQDFDGLASSGACPAGQALLSAAESGAARFDDPSAAGCEANDAGSGALQATSTRHFASHSSPPAVCNRAFLTPTTAASSSSKDVAADIADQPHEQHLANLLTPQHPLLLAELASSIDQRQQKNRQIIRRTELISWPIGSGTSLLLARSAYLLSTNLPDFIGLEATCRLIGQLAELTNRHRASSEVGDLLAAIASLTAALIRLESAPVALSELAGPALLRLGACASNWLGANSSNNSSSELALNLAADQNSGQLSDLELAELPSLVTACQACLGNSACSSQAGLGHRLLLPTLQVLSLIKRRVGFESWNRLVGDNRLLNQLLVDCSGLPPRLLSRPPISLVAASDAWNGPQGDGGAELDWGGWACGTSEPEPTRESLYTPVTSKAFTLTLLAIAKHSTVHWFKENVIDKYREISILSSPISWVPTIDQCFVDDENFAIWRPTRQYKRDRVDIFETENSYFLITTWLTKEIVNILSSSAEQVLPPSHNYFIKQLATMELARTNVKTAPDEAEAPDAVGKKIRGEVVSRGDPNKYPNMSGTFAGQETPATGILLANKCDLLSGERQLQTVREIETFCRENGFIGWTEVKRQGGRHD
uniref:RAP domain-containing protein n=1 Tax=Macrostomum lignano TaxID=282301 RepID=A0A1I8FBY1_9PLAT